MSISATDIQEPRAQDVRVNADNVVVELNDGRTLSVPLAWFPRLWHGSEEERAEFEIIGDGSYIHWPRLDEDLSVAGMLAGRRSHERSDSLKQWLAGRDRKSPGTGR
jgi:hypothetical protein